MNDAQARLLRKRLRADRPRGGPRLSALVVLSVLALATEVRAQHPALVPSPGLVSVSDLDSTIVLDIRYATDHNFVGSPIEGYEAPLCLLTPEAATALVHASEIVREMGYRLVVFDCYRPQRAVDHFVRWSYYALDQRTKSMYYPNVDKRLLFEYGYIASKSGHSRGSTVDVGLAAVVDSTNGGGYFLLDMGTPFDFFDTRSHTASPDVSDEHRRNRMTLVEVMRSSGFRNYPKEWWHFTLIGEPYTDSYFDVVVR